jgi:hypothetical protein
MNRGDHHKPDPTLAEIERQIAETREQLGAIVEELAAKADVPGRARAKAAETANRVRVTAHRAATAGRLHLGSAHGRDVPAGASGGHVPPGPVPAADAPADIPADIPADLPAGTRAGTPARRADTIHEAGARAAAKLNRVSEDQTRTLYAAASLALAAATIAAIIWAREHGDF